MASRRRIETDPEQPLPQVGERTGKHKCVQCLRDISGEEYFKNDFLCDACATKDEYPLASTPETNDKR